MRCAGPAQLIDYPLVDTLFYWKEKKMSDLKDKIYEVLQRPQLAGLATVTEEGKPWVRY